MTKKTPKKPQKTTSAKTSGGKKAEKPAAVDKEAAVLAALDLAVALGWEHVTLRDVAEETGADLAALFELFDDKSDILVALGRMIDKKTLEHAGSGDGDISTRDRLFDILMDRFDVLNEYRDGVIAVLNSFKFDPKQAVIAMPHLCKSMAWMLEAAGIETGGIKGAVKVAGLSGIYLKVLKTWKDDDSPDMGKTMAALDKSLGRAEQVANSFGF